MLRPVATLLVVVGVLPACTAEPDNYEDCILKHMPGTNEKLAVFAIEDACLSKFPKKEERSVSE